MGGRRSSAMGTMSVTEALRAFSVETIIAFPENDANNAIAEGLSAAGANFLAPLKVAMPHGFEGSPIMGARVGPHRRTSSFRFIRGPMLDVSPRFSMPLR